MPPTRRQSPPILSAVGVTTAPVGAGRAVVVGAVVVTGSAVVVLDAVVVT